MRRLVGLTGGIGSGKSTVAALLRAKGATVVDADQVARSVVEPGEPALATLVERFGDGILDPDGRLDRPALAAVAFADDDGRKALGEITWPAIGEEFERQIREAPDDAVVICDVPLLVESKAAAARPYVAVVVVEAPLDAPARPPRAPGCAPRRRRNAAWPRRRPTTSAARLRRT